MAEECTESSVAASSSTLNWWPDLHTSSSWSTTTNPWHTPNPHSNSPGEEDVSMSTSFTNASNHSGLSVESSRRLVECSSTNELIGETAPDNHLWSQVFLSVGSSGELPNGQDVGENLLDSLPSKNISSSMFEPACDYLKKIENSWEFTSSTSYNNLEKHFHGYNDTLIDSERLNRLSNLVSNWSIAPPDPQVTQQFDPRACSNSLSSNINQYSQPNFCSIKQPANSIRSFFRQGHDLKVEDDHREIDATRALCRRSFNSNGIRYQMGNNNSIVGENGKYYFGGLDVPCTNTRNFSDAVSFNSCLSKPLVDINASKPLLKTMNISDSKRQGIQSSCPKFQPTISTSSTLTRSSGRGQGVTSEGKKKRSEENSDTVLKKSKLEGSTASSAKLQVPKVKLTEKITSLQQIVSPFGKTDTASVLGEAIGYIKFLQEQVQLLSNPYRKSNVTKDPWGGSDRKDRGDVKLDLKSRGLCLVPISCTPQVYRENVGSDYWTPYRGCLYR
ncbi:unnamed protein product [Ilex paraguariensis]|uniref:BHLH domain-containing protein n=1 Tax=Ilex paraguariensis TaxID=185542 RepID=A0ABC8U8P6_9AQUA